MVPKHLSPSAAALWDQCPQRWWFRYVDGLPEPPPGEPVLRGSFVHRVLELLLGEAPADRTVERARDHARRAFEEIAATDDWRQLDLDALAARRFRQRCWATVELYLTRGAPAQVRPLARELRVSCEVAGVPFRGFVDLLELADEADPAGAGTAPGDGSVRDPRTPVVITDYKTGAPPAPRYRDAKLLQPLWYAAAIDALGEHRPVRVRLLHLVTSVDADDDNRVSGRVEEVALEVTDEQLEGARRALRQRWDAIQAAVAEGSADPAPGPLCGWCPYVTSCTVGERECRSRWGAVDATTGRRALRADAPAVALLDLDGSASSSPGPGGHTGGTDGASEPVGA